MHRFIIILLFIFLFVLLFCPAPCPFGRAGGFFSG
nr:MAG TPA: chitin synthase regulator [Caudoviricetes sp.]